MSKNFRQDKRDRSQPCRPPLLGHFSATDRRIMASITIMRSSRPLPSIRRAAAIPPSPPASKSSAEVHRRDFGHQRPLAPPQPSCRCHTAAVDPPSIAGRRYAIKVAGDAIFIVVSLLLLPECHHRLNMHKLPGGATSDTAALPGMDHPHPTPTTLIRRNI